MAGREKKPVRTIRWWTPALDGGTGLSARTVTVSIRLGWTRLRGAPTMNSHFVVVATWIFYKAELLLNYLT